MDPATLIQAHIARASALLITVPDSLLIRHLTGIARELNPEVRVLAHGATERCWAVAEAELRRASTTLSTALAAP